MFTMVPGEVSAHGQAWRRVTWLATRIGAGVATGQHCLDGGRVVLKEFRLSTAHAMANALGVSLSDLGRVLDAQQLARDDRFCRRRRYRHRNDLRLAWAAAEGAHSGPQDLLQFPLRARTAAPGHRVGVAHRTLCV